MGWDHNSMRKFLQLLFRHFGELNPATRSVNIYHGYFESLYKMAMYSKSKINIVQMVMKVLDEENQGDGVMQKLFNHMGRNSVNVVFLDILVVEYNDESALVEPSIKVLIIDHIISTIEEFIKRRENEEKVENCLEILKVFI